MTKTVSSRIPKDLHDKLRERCNQEGCNTNDFIRDILESELEQSGQDQKVIKDTKPESNINFFDERDGKLYLQSDKSFFGNISDFNFDKTNVYDKNHNLVGKRIFVEWISDKSKIDPGIKATII